MKIIKSVTLDLETVVKIDSLIKKGDFKSFSSFIQDSASEKLEKA